MKYLSLFIISFVVIISACNDSIEIGSGLLEDEQLEIQVDSLSISAQTILSDSVLTFRRVDENSDFTNTVYLVGQLDGPEFGQSDSWLASMLIVSSTRPPPPYRNQTGLSTIRISPV